MDNNENNSMNIDNNENNSMNNEVSQSNVGSFSNPNNYKTDADMISSRIAASRGQNGISQGAETPYSTPDINPIDQNNLSSRINDSKQKAMQDNSARAAEAESVSNEESASDAAEKTNEELPKEDIKEGKEGESSKGSFKDNLKLRAKNTAINKAAERDDLIGKAGRTYQRVQKAKQTVNNAKKAAKITAKVVKAISQAIVKAVTFLFTTPVGWVILAIIAIFLLIVLIVVVINSILSTFEINFSETDADAYESFYEYYDGQNYTLEEIEAMYTNSQKNGAASCGKTSWLEKIKLSFGKYDLSDPTELCLFLRTYPKKYAKEIYIGNLLEIPWTEVASDGALRSITASTMRDIKENYSSVSIMSIEIAENKGYISKDDDGNYTSGEGATIITSSDGKLSVVYKDPDTPSVTNHDAKIAALSDAAIDAFESAESNNKFGLTFSPGLFYSTLYYAYETQNYDANGNPTITVDKKNGTDEDEETTNDFLSLDAISALFSKKIYDRNKLETLFTSEIHNGFNYYTREDIYDEEGNKIGSYCKPHFVSNMVDEERYFVFLRYGASAANYYEQESNKNMAIDMTDESCYSSLPRQNKIALGGFNDTVDITDNDRTLISLHISSDGGVYSSRDNDGIYKYETGYLYQTFPKFNSAYTVDKQPVRMDYTYAREEEDIIAEIDSRKEFINMQLGYPSNLAGYGVNSSGEWSTWKQQNPDVGGIIIGRDRNTSSGIMEEVTFGAVGCYFTSVAMAIADKAPYIAIPNYNLPNLINAALEGGVFTSDGRTDTDRLLRVATGSTVEWSTGRMDTYLPFKDKIQILKNMMDKGYAVVLQVKNSITQQQGLSRGDSHFVYVTGLSEDAIYVADPDINQNGYIVKPDALGQPDVLKYYNQGINFYYYFKFD